MEVQTDTRARTLVSAAHSAWRRLRSHGLLDFELDWGARGRVDTSLELQCLGGHMPHATVFLAPFLSFLVLVSCARSASNVETRTSAGTLANPTVTTPPPVALLPMQAVLDKHASLGPKPVEQLTPSEARQQATLADAVRAMLRQRGEPTAPEASVPGVQSVDRTVNGASGQLRARSYTPSGAGPFRAIVYYHGGGWVVADKDVHDASARGLSNAAKAIVISVDYRQAPEHKFPAAHDDAIAAYKWALANAGTLNGDSLKIALAGEDAGGNLAIATAMAARDERIRPPVHVLAIYPIAGTDTTTASYVRNANARPLNRAMMSWFLSHAIRTTADLQDKRLNLVTANLAALPPVTIITAEIDPLATEGRTLADRLRLAGVDVERREWRNVTHEFFGLGAVLEAAREAQAYAGRRLQESFER